MKSDNLENLFRSKFKEPSSDEMDWLDPSDAIFDQALASYKNEGDDRKKPLIWRLAASGVFLALITAGAYFFWNNTEDRTDINQNLIESTVIENNTAISTGAIATQSNEAAANLSSVSYTHLTLPTIYSV